MRRCQNRSPRVTGINALVRNVSLPDYPDRVLKAQLARGADLDRGSIVKRMKAFIPVLVPLFVIVFQTADDLAVAMEARCYRGGEGRSRMKPFAWRFADTAALVFCFALVVGQKLLNWYVG